MRSAIGVVLAWCAATAAGAQDRAPSVVVLPFTTEGSPGDATVLRASADRTVQELNKVLWADSSVRWLVYRTRQRPQDPRTGFVMAARYGVVGAVRAGAGDSIWIRFQLVSVETMDLLLRDSVSGLRGQEAILAPLVARRMVASLHADARRPRATPTDSVPAAAVALVARATEELGRGDTVSAVGSLREALAIAPRWNVPCVMLRRFRPAAACP